VLDERGTPGVVERALIYPPRTQLAPLSDAEREAIVRRSPLFGHYEQLVDRESAYERLHERAAAAQPPPAPAQRGSEPDLGKIAVSVGTSVARAMGTQLGRQIVRGVLGSFFGSRRRR
jgi:DNA helicase HerA-like ATPase